MDFLTRSLRIRVARLEHRMTLCQARLRDLEAAVLRAQEAPPPTYLEAVSRFPDSGHPSVTRCFEPRHFTAIVKSILL